MSLGLLACTLGCAFAPQLHGTEGDEARTFLWPLGSGYAQYALLTTYGQPQGNGNRLHAGLDVSDRNVATAQRSRSVYALEDGIVERVYVDETENYISGLVVASKAVTGRAWLYLHLEKGSLRFAEGEEVRINQILGDVLQEDKVTEVEHLHLSRLGGDFRNQEWVKLGELNERNPLALLRPEALGDSRAPIVENLGGDHFRFRPDESSSSSGTYPRTAIPASTGSQPLPTDVLVCVRDEDGGPHLGLAPYRLRLTIKDVPEKTFLLCLDGPLPKPDALCERVKRGRDLYDFYFILTNGAEDCVSGPDITRAWNAEAGQHPAELTVEDVAGYKTTVPTVFEAQDP